MTTDLLHRSPYDAWRWAEELFGRRDYIGAARALESLLEHPETEGTDTSQVEELLARSYYHSARLAPAERATRAILEREPANGYMALLLSRTLERSGQKEEAEKYRLRALALGEDV